MKNIIRNCIKFYFTFDVYIRSLQRASIICFGQITAGFNSDVIIIMTYDTSRDTFVYVYMCNTICKPFTTDFNNA